jgi:hypothetical protein
MASVVGICNRALQRLGAARIASLSDDSKNARACNNAYEPVRDALLRRYRWSFAITRVQLAADATAPIETDGTVPDGNAFTLPADCLGIIPPNMPDLDWTVEGRKIITDWAAPLNVRYKKIITDPNDMHADFREALALQLAAAMCEEVTQSNTKMDSIKDDIKTALADAKRNNAYEQTPDTPPDDTWITARA